MSALDHPAPIDLACQREVAAALRAFLPESAVLFNAEDVKPYECDGLSAFRQLPMVVALPENESQVQRVLQICHRLKVPVVPRGAGTGLSAGALPLGNGVLLSLAKLMRIVNIDPLARTARVQPGVRNLAISEAAAVHGLYYAPDPSSQIACSIGGNVAENSGGMHCLKYGLTVHNILHLRAYTYEGELLEIGCDGLDAAGYDLLALLTGSEGLLAVITEITVKLLPKPERAQCVLAAFDDVAKAGQAVANIIAAGIIPAGLEMMDKITTGAVEPFVNAGYPLDAEAILLCESDGATEEVADEIERMKAVMQASGATEVRVSQSEAERVKFWAGRKAAFPAAGRVSPDYYCMDGTIPKRALARMLQAIAELSKEYGLRCMNVFHAGDGNLHPLILYDANQPGELARTEEFGAKILKLSIDVGGTITGEHGVGVEKIDAMCDQFRASELEMFHAVKRAFDPAGLLNPGKAVPTLHRCAEMGRMHVHGGEEKFPNIQDSSYLKYIKNMLKKQLVRSTLAALVLTCGATGAHAISDEIQVYTDDINKPGEFGLELHINTTPRGRKTPDYPGDSPPHHGLRFTPEFSYGINKDWEAGLYLPTVRDASGNFSAAGVKLRLKWLPLKGDEETGGWYAGANMELSSINKKYSESRLGSELRIMTGYRAKEWHLAVNPILGYDLSKGYRRGGPSFDLATKAVHGVVDGVALGVEYYTGMGKLAKTLPSYLQENTVYAVMDWDRKPFAFNFGVGKGLNGATDKWSVKTIIEVPFK